MDIGGYTLNLAPLILLAAVAALIVLQMVWGSHYRSDIAKQQLRLERLEKRLAAAQKDKKQLHQGLFEIKRRQLQNEARNASARRGDRTDLTYELAVKLARRGIAVEELAKICGLTKGEAELLSLANGTRRHKLKNYDQTNSAANEI